jgi:hypothetical protein
MSKPTANWEKVGDKFYRKVQLYTAVFDQDLELDKYNVVGAPYSGAVGGYAALSSFELRSSTKNSQPSTVMKRSFIRIAALVCPSRVSIYIAALAS